MTGLLTRRRGGAINRETRQMIEDSIRRTTVFPDVSLDRLDDGEQRELAQLLDEATVPSGGTNFKQLTDKQRQTYERLVERAAGQPGAFKAERDALALRDRAAAIARRAAKATRPKPGGEAALWEQVGEHLARREAVLHSEHILTLALILSQLAHGKTVAPQSRIEDGALVLHDSFGPVGANLDEYELVGGRWQSAARHLQANQYLDIERRGPEWVIRPGRRVARALWGQS